MKTNYLRFPLVLVSILLPTLILVISLSLINGYAASLKTNFSPNRLIVKFHPGTVEAEGLYRPGKDLAALGVESIQRIFQTTDETLDSSSTAVLEQFYVVQLKAGIDPQKARFALEQNPYIEWVELDYLAYAAETHKTPDDPLFFIQWGLEKINAPAAWDIVTGTSTVVIAVIDSGIDFSHPDFAGKLWVNPGEIAGNGQDDDNNGFIDDVNGWDFVSDDNDPADDNGHGTQVSGIAAAGSNNGLGIAGTCWNCQIMVVKVMQASGVANYSDIAAGVLYAAQKGAKVINISLGGYSTSNALQLAIQSAVETYGAVVVAGAGNDNTNTAFYPAAYPQVMAVAGTDSSDLKSSFSNYGDWVDVSAPAAEITTTFMGGDYGPVDGTSFSAPFAAGLAGLLRSQHPGWSQALVHAQILRTASDIDTLNTAYARKLGNGRIDAFQAVSQTPHPVLAIASLAVNGDPLGRFNLDEVNSLQVTLSNDWLDASAVTGKLTTSDPYVTIEQDQASFGDVLSSASGASSPLYAITVATAASYNHSILFNLALSANDGGYTLTLPITLTTRSANQNVSGTISVNTTWTSDKTYIVMNNVGVAPGVTLTIQAGTVIKFNGNYSLNVGGTLIADGTQNQPIRFTSNTSNSWGRIYFDDHSQDATSNENGAYLGGNLLRWVQIEDAAQGIGCNKATPYLSHVTTDGGGINCTLGLTPLWLQDSDLVSSAIVVADQLLGAYDTPGDARGVAVSEGYAYVADYSYGLRVIDVSNPTSPTEVGFYNTPGEAISVVLGDSHAYVADGGSGLRVVDISTPANPVEVGFFVTASTAYNLALSGEFAYLATLSDGLHIINVSDPTHPTAAGFYDTPGAAHGVAISGSHAYVADYFSLRVLDISDPTHPTEVGSYETPGDAISVAVIGSYAYLADGGSGLRVLDISNPASPTEIGFYDTPIYAQHVTISGDFAYVADTYSTQVINVSSPTRSIGVGFYDTSGETCSVAVSDGYVYAADRHTGLRIYRDFGVMNVSAGNTTLRGGNLSLPDTSQVYKSSVSGSITAGKNSLVQNTTAGGGIQIGNGTIQNNAVTGSIAIGSGQVLSNTISGGGVSAGAYSLVQGNNIENGFTWGIQASEAVTITGNRLVNNASGIQIGSGWVQGNLIADSRGVGLEITGNTAIISNTFTGISGSAVRIQDLTGKGNLSGLRIQGNNFEFNSGLYEIENLNPYSTLASLPAHGNWWGTTDIFLIDDRIFDFNDEYNNSAVQYLPVAGTPIQTAPAYVRSVTVTPETVGIETATFDVQFSRPMDISTLPGLTFQSVKQDSWTIYNSSNSGLPTNMIKSVVTAPDGSHWFGTEGGVVHLSETTWTIYNMSNSGLPSNSIWEIAADPDGSLWFGTPEGVAHFDGNTWIVYNSSNSGLPGNSVYEITTDPDGSHWFGTMGGAAHFDGITWSVVLSGMDVWAIARDPDGSHWFGTLGYGVEHFDGTTWTIYNTSNSGLPDNYVMTIVTEPDGSHWFGTSNGLANFDDATWRIYYTNNSGLPSNVIEVISIDPDGSKWFGTTNGIAYLKGNVWKVYNTSNSELPGNIVYGIAADPDGSHWFSTSNGASKLWNYPSYPVTENQQWPDSSHFQASFEITSLIPRDSYTITAEAAYGLDGIRIAPNTTFTFTVGYAGGISDITLPPAPLVTACSSNTPDTLSATWTANDPDSSITLYRYAIGTTPGSADVVNWTNTSATSFLRSGLGLIQGLKYYISVMARNEGGLWSLASTPPGVTAGVTHCTSSVIEIFIPLIRR